MSRPFRKPVHHGAKPRTKEQIRVAAFMLATLHRDAPRMTDEEREEALRKLEG